MNENPYRPPESKLINNDGNQGKRSIWWKVYFFIFTMLYALSTFSLSTHANAGIAEIFDNIIFITSTIGLFGFVFLKPIYKPEFWLTVLLISLAYGVLYFYISNIDLRFDMTEKEYYLNLAIGWFISLPQLYALYTYSKPSNPIWSKLSNSDYTAF